MKKDSVYLNKETQNDNVYGNVELVNTSDMFGGRDVASKMVKTVISNDRVVSTCSASYGLLTNKDFFGKMEHELIEEGINYKTRSFNHNDSRYSVDYILDDDSKVIVVNDQKSAGVDDTLVPMIRLTNSYDGSAKTAGYLGFFRKVCHNGLHMATTQMEFKVKHTKGNMEVFIPKIGDLVQRFLDNEVYSINDKIKKMKAHLIEHDQIQEWIADLAEQDKIFKPIAISRAKETEGDEVVTKTAQLVEDILLRDTLATGVEPNAWLIYSAFNEVIHGKLQNVFEKQKQMDTRVFNSISEMVS